MSVSGLTTQLIKMIPCDLKIASQPIVLYFLFFSVKQVLIRYNFSHNLKRNPLQVAEDTFAISRCNWQWFQKISAAVAESRSEIVTSQAVLDHLEGTGTYHLKNNVSDLCLQ